MMTSFRARPLALGIFLYLLGILALTQSDAYALILCLSVGLFALSAILAAWMYRKRTAKRGYTYPLLLSVSFFLLFCHTLVFCQSSLFPALSLRGGTHTLEAVVEETYGDSLLLRAEGVPLYLLPPETDEELSPPQSNDRIRITFTADAKPEDPQGKLRPYGVLVTGQWTEFEFLETLPLSPWEQLRKHLVSLLSPLRNADLAGAVLLGEKQGDPSLYDALDHMQTQHLLCVSGLHVSLLLSGLRKGFNKLRFSRRVQGILLFFLCLFYAALLDFSPSVCRAAIMTLMAHTAGTLRKNGDSLTSLFLSAGILVLADPFCLYDLSFQLSFLATLGILRLYVPLSLRLERSKLFRKDVIFPLFLLRGLFKNLLLSLLMCGSAVGFALPVLLKLSPNINLLGFFANMILVVLFVPVLLASGLYLLLALLFSALSLPEVLGFFAFLCDGILDVFSGAAEALRDTSLPFAMVSEESFGLAIALCALLLFGVFLFHDRRLLLPLCLFVALFPLLWGIKFAADQDRVAQIHLLYNSRQRALLLQKDEAALLYLPDGLRDKSSLDLALSLQGILHLDAVILSTDRNREHSLTSLDQAYHGDAYYLPATALPIEELENLPLLPLPEQGPWEPIPKVSAYWGDIQSGRRLELLVDEVLFSYCGNWDLMPVPYTSLSGKDPDFLFVCNSPFLYFPSLFSQATVFADESYCSLPAASQGIGDSQLLSLTVYRKSYRYRLWELWKNSVGSTESKFAASLAEASGPWPPKGSKKYE